VAWEPLGWEAAWLSEIEAFPSAVLAHHWPDVPNLGDMTLLPERVAAGEVEAPDVLVGGTPCQAFSVAGRRESLADARGNLTLTYVELADAIDDKRNERGEQPAIIVWENVPGVLNTKDNAFGCFLAGLAGEDVPLQPPGKRWTNAGLVLGPKRAVAWRILDAQYFGVAQRRRRVFVVASARDGFDPSQILFEFDGVRRDPAPSREARQDAATDAGRGVASTGSHWDNVRNPHPSLNQAAKGSGGIGASNQEVFSQRGAGVTWPAEVASTLNAAFGSKLGLEDQHINGGAPLFVPSARDYKYASDLAVQPVNTQIATRGGALGERTGFGIGSDSDPAYTLQAGYSHAVFTYPALGLQTDITPKANHELQFTLKVPSSSGGGQPAACMDTQLAVRRLTPVETERLQGFPDGHTDVPYRNKPAADGPRYKAIGNSMAVPVMAWIGRRIIHYLASV
jgi:DNA (cytosine-5)-methyltransferase 1